MLGRGLFAHVFVSEALNHAALHEVAIEELACSSAASLKHFSRGSAIRYPRSPNTAGNGGDKTGLRYPT